MAEQDDFPGCCGIGVIYDLDYKEAGFTLQGYITETMASSCTAPLLLATTAAGVNSQESVDTLEKNGFKPVFTFRGRSYSPSSGNVITLWARGTFNMVPVQGALTATEMLESVRATLQCRLEGHNGGGDIEVMRLVDKIVRREVNRRRKGLRARKPKAAR